MNKLTGSPPSRSFLRTNKQVRVMASKMSHTMKTPRPANAMECGWRRAALEHHSEEMTFQNIRVRKEAAWEHRGQDLQADRAALEGLRWDRAMLARTPGCLESPEPEPCPEFSLRGRRAWGASLKGLSPCLPSLAPCVCFAPLLPPADWLPLPHRPHGRPGLPWAQSSPRGSSCSAGPPQSASGKTGHRRVSGPATCSQNHGSCWEPQCSPGVPRQEQGRHP